MCEQDSRGIELFVFRENAFLKNFSLSTSIQTISVIVTYVLTRSGSDRPIRTGQDVELFGKKDFLESEFHWK